MPCSDASSAAAEPPASPPASPPTPSAADALAWAVHRLDSEEHRYVERFTWCPNGCEFEYPGGSMRRTAGPIDCEDCDHGTVEDEDARHIDPLIDALRRLSEVLGGRP